MNEKDLNLFIAEKYSESPIEFRFFSTLALMVTDGFATYFPKTGDLPGLMAGLDDHEWGGGYIKAYLAHYNWIIFIQAGFPKLRRRADAVAWPGKAKGRPVVIECDGFDFHSSKQQMTNDRKRDRQFLKMGYRVVRFTGSEISTHPVGSCRELVRILMESD